MFTDQGDEKEAEKETGTDQSLGQMENQEYGKSKRKKIARKREKATNEMRLEIRFSNMRSLLI